MQQEDAFDAGAVCQVAPGTRLGSCELLLGIARGGMAQVWAARQHGARGFNRLVAVKTVLPELAEAEFEEMFLEEARLAARIHHPNVCEIFELVESGGVLALAMEWIHGDTLHALLEASRTRLDRRVSAQIVAHVASGLHAAHELRDECGVPLHIVHRDVSPHNVLISRDGHVKVTDFGVAKAIGGAREETVAGQIKGKPGYLSPEQARCEPLDRRSDIFSLGVLLYVATVQGHPFRSPGQRRRQQILNLLADQLTPPSALAPDYPKALEAIVLKAIRHDPKERFSTADEMRRELCNWILTTGGLVTEKDISGALLEHLGHVIDERGERVAQALLASRERQALPVSAVVLARDAVARAPAGPILKRRSPAVPQAQMLELTLAPTSSCAPRWGWHRARLRLALPVLAAVGCAGIGALGFSRAWSLQKRVPNASAPASPASGGSLASVSTEAGEAGGEPGCSDARSGLKLADLPLVGASGARLLRTAAAEDGSRGRAAGAALEWTPRGQGEAARQERARAVASAPDAALPGSQPLARPSAEPAALSPAAAPAPARAGARQDSPPVKQLRPTSAHRASEPPRIGPRETEL